MKNILFLFFAAFIFSCKNGASDEKNETPYPLSDTNKTEFKNAPPPQDSARTKDSMPTG